MNFHDVELAIPEKEVYGIVYRISWNIGEGNEVVYVGSKVLGPRWRDYKTSSVTCRGYWLIREPDEIRILDIIRHNPDLTKDTLHKYLLCRENEAILFANMAIGRRDHILNKADVRGGRLPGQSRRPSRRKPRKRSS